MSQAVSGTDDDGEEAESEEDPEIEDVLFEEELRIDGICGVY